MKIRMNSLLALVCAASLLSSVALAQAGQAQAGGSEIQIRTESPGAMVWATQGEGTFTFVSSEMGFEGKVVKGAPFSAQTVSEHVQVMADGNRIVNTNTGAIYRDSEGRTRREQQITAFGAYTADKAPAHLTMIHDPVAGTSYSLDTTNKTAVKHPSRTFNVEVRRPNGGSGSSTTTTTTATVTTGASTQSDGPAPGGRHAGPPREMSARAGGPMGDAKTESLGTQTIEGVQAEGTRTTHVIPAGTFGNEQPINIVSERWYSPELQTVILSKHSDPRSGESTFKLVNISRDEPAAALFQVPSDYTVTEGRGPGGPGMREMRAPRKPKEQ